MASPVVELINHTWRLLESNQFKQVDHLLLKSEAGLTTDTPEMLIARLRASSAARMLLKRWHPYRDRVRDELARRRLNVGKLLTGLV